MSKYHPFHPDHEILGSNMIDIASAINSQNFLPIYEKHGLLDDIDPAAWYPIQTIFDVLNEVTEMPGSMLDLVSIGMQGVNVTEMPPEFAHASFDDIMTLVPKAYQMNHRGTDVGGIEVEKLSDTHYRQLCRLPFPDDFWYGVIYGYVRRFAPEGMTYQVYYDPDIPRRDEGGDVTIVHIELE